MKRIFRIIFLITLPFLSQVSAQPYYNWAKSISSGSGDDHKCVINDAQGNVFSGGAFMGTIDLDPGPGVFTVTSLGFSDAFVVKLNPSGNLIWAKVFGSATGNEMIESMVTDASGNLYLSSNFSGTIDVDPGPGIQNFNSINVNSDLFVTKLDQSGNFLWSGQIGANGTDIVNALTLDNSGNVIIGGRFNGNVDFDPSMSTYTMQSTGVWNGFIAKWNSSGAFIWAKQLAGNNTSEVFALACDASSNVFSIGSFNGSTDFDPGVGTNSLTGVNDVFILKLDLTGSFSWANSFTGGGTDVGKVLSINNSGDLIVGGVFNGTIDVQPGPGITNLISNAATDDLFLVNYSNAGSLIWGTVIGGSGNEANIGVDLDQNNNIFLTGSYTSTMDIDPGLGTTTVSFSGANDVFVSKLDPNANLIWYATFNLFTSERGKAISVFNNDIIYVAGEYGSNLLDFDPGPGTATLTAPGGGDNFLLKLSQCPVPTSPSNTTSNSSMTVCSGQSTTLTATGSGTINWYSTPGFTTIPVSGSSFSTGNLAAGTHSYYISSKTCVESTVQTVVTVTSYITPTINISGNPICSGANATLQASSATSYSWSTGATTSSIIVSPSITTNYTVVGINNPGLCSATATVSQVVQPLPTLTVTGNGSICAGNSATINVNGAVSYSWNTGATTNSIIVSPTVTSNYTVTGTNTLTNCARTETLSLEVNICTTISEQNSNSGFEIFPNPVVDILIVNLMNDSEINLYDLTGKIIFSEVRTAGKAVLNLELCEPGVFLLSISGNNGKSYRKIIKQ